jgi:hypothetical protein
MATEASWQPFDLSSLAERLEAARALLEQAAALAAAQDAAKVMTIAQLAERTEGGGHGHAHRQREYR